MTQTGQAPTLIERMKKGIWDIHEGVAQGTERAEPSEQDNIMKGTLPRFKYVNHLGQRWILQREFERVLAKHRKSVPQLAAVVGDEQFHAEKSAIDLHFFGVDPGAVQPLPATQAFVEFVERTAERDPRLLLAIHYVIEGSNNGARFIARAVRRAYDLQGTDGTFHLDPYGEAQKQKWKEFGDAFNACAISEDTMREMVAVGRSTFGHMNAIGAESYAVPEKSA